MPVYNNVGDTIEGLAVDCDGRVFKAQGVKKHPVTKRTMKLYITDRNSHAVVAKAGVIPEDENLKSVTCDFHRNVGDKITGDALSIYTDLRGAVKIETVHGQESATHRHGTQYANIRKHTIATVKMPLQNLMKQLGFSNNSLTVQDNAN